MWQNWFAWYPIAYGPHIAWLRTIQRRWVKTGNTSHPEFGPRQTGYWLYRNLRKD